MRSEGDCCDSRTAEGPQVAEDSPPWRAGEDRRTRSSLTRPAATRREGRSGGWRSSRPRRRRHASARASSEQTSRTRHVRGSRPPWLAEVRSAGSTGSSATRPEKSLRHSVGLPRCSVRDASAEGANAPTLRRRRSSGARTPRRRPGGYSPSPPPGRASLPGARMPEAVRIRSAGEPSSCRAARYPQRRSRGEPR